MLDQKKIKPFFSILLIISTLFLIAFSKLTLRRLSYSLYQESREFHRIQEEYYFHLKEYSRVTRTERLEYLAKRQSFNKRRKGQIIQVIDGKAVIVD